MQKLRPIKANKSLDILMFMQGFCDTIEEAKLCEHYKVANANYKQFRVEQSFSQPHKVKVSYFALPGKEFSLIVNLNDLNKAPAEYLERTLDMINEAREKLKKGNIEVLR